MSNYRVRESGDIKSQGEIRKLHPNTSIPKVWDSNVCDALEIDPIIVSRPPPPSEPYKVVVRNGVTEDENGNWVEAWVEQDMFAATDDATKEEQEAAYQARLDENAAEKGRLTRTEKLVATDWHGLSDNEMSAEMTTYRQALRDVPQQEGFPNEIDWPVEPS